MAKDRTGGNSNQFYNITRQNVITQMNVAVKIDDRMLPSYFIVTFFICLITDLLCNYTSFYKSLSRIEYLCCN